MHLAMDRNDDFVAVLLVVGARAIIPGASREMATNSSDPPPDGLTAGSHAKPNQHILNVSSAQRKTVEHPNVTGNAASEPRFLVFNAALE